jgi:hypothetical protein
LNGNKKIIEISQLPLLFDPFPRLLPLRHFRLAIVVVLLARRTDVFTPIADPQNTLSIPTTSNAAHISSTSNTDTYTPTAAAAPIQPTTVTTAFSVVTVSAPVTVISFLVPFIGVAAFVGCGILAGRSSVVIAAVQVTVTTRSFW